MTPQSSRPPSVLVVDDNPDLARMIHLVLERNGYSVVTVTSGKEAAARLETTDFNIVITDIVMNDVDGTDIIRLARERPIRPRVIAISGGGAMTSAGDALLLAQTLGADVTLRKPFSFDQLLAVMKAERPAIAVPVIGTTSPFRH